MLLRRKPVKLEELTLEELGQLFGSNILDYSDFYVYSDAQFIIDAIENTEGVYDVEFVEQYLKRSFESVIKWVLSENELIICDRDRFHRNLIKILQQCPEITSKGRFIKLNNLYYIYRNYQHYEVNKYLENNIEHYKINNTNSSVISKYYNGWLTTETKAVQDYRRAILFIERLYNFIFISQLNLDQDIISYLKSFYLLVNNEFKMG